MKQSVTILLMISFLGVNAQGLEIGAGLGGTMYWGDLTPSDPTENFGNIRGAGSIYLRNTITPKLSLRANILMGKLAGDDGLSSTQWMNERNLSFFSTIVEGGFMLEYDLISLPRGGQWDFFELYGMVGLTGIFFNPKTEFQGNTYTLQPLGTEGQGMVGFPEPYSTVSAAFPVGMGIKIKITDNLILNPEFGVRFTLTDYLDDVGGRYVDDNLLRAGNGDLAADLANRTAEFFGQTEPINRAGNRRGGDARDLYYIGMIHLAYRFNNKFSLFKGRSRYDIGCPTF